MKHLLFVLLFFLISAGVFSQTIKTETMVILENQKNQDIIEVNELWKKYLTESCPDSLYDNPCCVRKTSPDTKVMTLFVLKGICGYILWDMGEPT